MTITRAKASEVNDEVEYAMRTIARAHGLIFEPGRVTWDPTQVGGRFTFKAMAVATPPSTTATSPGIYNPPGIPPITAVAKRRADSLGFVANNPNPRGFILVDYKSQNFKYPWIVISTATHKRYKITEYQAMTYFKPAAATPAITTTMEDVVMGARHTSVGQYEAKF